VLSFLGQGKLVIAVMDNHTAMEVTHEHLGAQYQGQIITARSYAEAVGFIVAHKAGILLDAISSTVRPIQVERMDHASGQL